jgi:CheY-like chemotaxis protein
MNEVLGDRNRRILIVDDDEAIHTDFRKVLAHAPLTTTDLDESAALVFGEDSSESKEIFDLHDAFQGQEGLELVRSSLIEKRPFAMAFVDMRMPPGWDGLQTIQRIWEADPDIQVVICTAYSDSTFDSQEALRAD